jgi:hypothetical protein
VVVGAAVGPAVLASIGCNVDISKLPGLPDELPNIVGVPVPVATDASAGSSSSSGSSSSGNALPGSATGTAMSVCDTAAAFLYSAGGSACQTCENTSCTSEYTNCQTTGCGTSTCCSAAAQCVFNCSTGACVADCISTSDPTYRTFVDCLLANCPTQCGWSPALTCPLPSDAGPG